MKKPILGTESGCTTGGCCKAFPLPYGQTLEKLLARPDRYEDGEAIAEMLIPLGVRDPSGRELFGCRNIDPVTNRCMIYERRPFMCRNYPYGMRCPVIGCTLSPNPPSSPW